MLDREMLESVIRPTLQHLAKEGGIPYSEAAARLLLGTAIHESGDFRWLRQVNGPALSFWQMEPATLEDCYTNFLDFRPAMLAAVDELRGPALTRAGSLETNLVYAAAMCRVKYYRARPPLPEEDDAEGMAQYHKRFYNGPGKADPAKTVAAFRHAITV